MVMVIAIPVMAFGPRPVRCLWGHPMLAISHGNLAAGKELKGERFGASRREPNGSLRFHLITLMSCNEL